MTVYDIILPASAKTDGLKKCAREVCSHLVSVADIRPLSYRRGPVDIYPVGNLVGGRFAVSHRRRSLCTFRAPEIPPVGLRLETHLQALPLL